ncbi:hypothetical protein SSX86_003207 [Deinandra increscens subsp. villosa]|uniref:Uracil-DNA glycosylase n=1 Tax=Deinandra increscens subsp. villosa TaxID=3103831 RepID=A0AAP0DPR2_9ASTR
MDFELFSATNLHLQKSRECWTVTIRASILWGFLDSSNESKRLGVLKLEELLVEETWMEAIPGEFEKPYAKKLSEFVESEIQSSIPIYPPQHMIFNALNSTPFDKVKAVIIGQDPYHGPGQAMGLSFSVPQGIKTPSSLINIYKELQRDLGCSIPSHGNLERWAVQGVLLLNAVLTVRQHQANSHAKKGWEQFTDFVIETISKKRTGVVFLLWGNYAQAKSRLKSMIGIVVVKICILFPFLFYMNATHDIGTSEDRWEPGVDISEQSENLPSSQGSFSPTVDQTGGRNVAG